MTKLYNTTNWPKLGLDETAYPFIGTVDATPEIGRVLDAPGKKFSVHILNRKEGTAGVRPLSADLNASPEVNEFEQHIICPYCGHVDYDSFERSDEDTVECPVCGGTIHYERVVTVEYTTEPVKPPKPIQAKWVRDSDKSPLEVRDEAD